MKNHLYEHFP
jgi:hypothetical protein